ncbi:MAG: hypothetical protein Kow0037_04780 [Calditrichia bacterium]
MNAENRWHSPGDDVRTVSLQKIQTTLEALLADLNEFTGSTPQSDDITALNVCRKGN